MNDMNEISVKIEELPDMNVASVRHIGSYSEIGEAFGALFAWAGPRGLVNATSKTLGMYFDSPESTPTDKLRSDACVTVPEGTQGEGLVTVKKLSTNGRYAFGHFEFDGKEGFQKAWNAMMGVWLPQSSFQCDDRPCFEIYHNGCSEEHEHFIVDICIPVRPL